MIRSRTVITGLAAGLLALAACRDGKTTAKPPAPATVLVGAVQRRDVPLYVETVATLDGYANVDIRARVRGFLHQQLYQDGATVKEGEVLFTIDPAEYVAALQTAKANLARARAAQAHAHALLERKRALAPSGVVSQQELDDADAQERDAAGQVEAAKGGAGAGGAEPVVHADPVSLERGRGPGAGPAGKPGRPGRADPAHDGVAGRSHPRHVPHERDRLRALAHARSRRSAAVASTGRGASSPPCSAPARPRKAIPGSSCSCPTAAVYPQRGVLVAANRQVDPSTGTIQLQALFPNPDAQPAARSVRARAHAPRPGRGERARRPGPRPAAGAGHLLGGGGRRRQQGAAPAGGGGAQPRGHAASCARA